MPVAYKRRISVNRPLTVFLLAPVGPYSSEVQQLARTTAVPRACQNGGETADIEL